MQYISFCTISTSGTLCNIYIIFAEQKKKKDMLLLSMNLKQNFQAFDFHALTSLGVLHPKQTI